jgi:membrane-associated HD superfamily phosphohydrolase
MDIISFKKIRLFKSSEILPRRAQPAQPPGDNKEEEPPPGPKLLRSPFPVLAFFVTFLSLIISYAPSRRLSVPGVGEIAGADIIAPSDLTIEDQETTAKRRVAAEQAVLPAYALDKNGFPETEALVRRFFERGREWLQSPAGDRKPEALQKEFLDRLGIEIEARPLTALA